MAHSFSSSANQHSTAHNIPHATRSHPSTRPHSPVHWRPTSSSASAAAVRARAVRTKAARDRRRRVRARRRRARRTVRDARFDARGEMMCEISDCGMSEMARGEIRDVFFLKSDGRGRVQRHSGSQGRVRRLAPMRDGFRV